MKTSLLTAIALALMGCATTPQQAEVAGIRAVGESFGAYLLQKNSSNTSYLAQYEQLVPKVADVMQGAMTPADFHTLMILLQSVTKNPTPQQAAIIGLLNSISSSFVQYNGGATPTPDGALADAAAKTLATGMVDSVGLVTGTNWSPPPKF